MTYGFLGASKALMGMLGVPLGPVRMPLKNLNGAQQTELLAALEPFSDCFPRTLTLPKPVASVG
jgi:dihydrodipicolinate synthase/N-acetylneuraminate lyase